MGFLAIVGSVLIGEYSSPKNRGGLLATITLFIIIGILIVHSLGNLLQWRTLSVLFAGISILDLMIILYSPESPSFLATRGKYDECRKAFHWLRGRGEEEELERLIKMDIVRKENAPVDTNRSILSAPKKLYTYIKTTLSKKEVYKPIFIELNMCALNQWSGAIMFNVYTRDIVSTVVGDSISFALVVITLDVQRLISSIISIITVKNIRRRLVFSVMTSVNIFGFLSIALYVYLKTHNLLSFDHPFIGIILLHIHLFSQSAGTMTFSNIIPGEIFPLEHRGLCGIFAVVYFSINETINIKTVPYLFSSLGLHGAYLLYASLVFIFFIGPWMILPETKDRMLMDIEEEFRGKKMLGEVKLVEHASENDKRLDVTETLKV